MIINELLMKKKNLLAKAVVKRHAKKAVIRPADISRGGCPMMVRDLNVTLSQI